MKQDKEANPKYHLQNLGELGIKDLLNIRELDRQKKVEKLQKLLEIEEEMLDDIH